jgi:RNA polymerase sigma-70 factor (ECF subfamily)
MRLRDVDLPAELLARARAGDARAQEAVYRSCARPAHALARRLVRGPAADDVVHDAFLDAFRGLAGYDARAPFGIWFRAIVVRRCLMHLRSPWQRGRELLDDWLEAPAPAASTGATLDLERALARLPATMRLVVWLHDVEGYTHGEIAAATGRSVAASKSALSRARARLRAWLDGTATRTAEEDACTRTNRG